MLCVYVIKHKKKKMKNALSQKRKILDTYTRNGFSARYEADLSISLDKFSSSFNNDGLLCCLLLIIFENRSKSFSFHGLT